jgi:hypothetical protein
MSGFDFGLQFLDADRMTYWGKRRDANFWIENASVKWNEAEAPFHTVARLTLLSRSQLPQDAGEAKYFDVTAHSTPDSMPIGSINRARQHGELASRKARMRRGAVVNHNKRGRYEITTKQRIYTIFRQMLQSIHSISSLEPGPHSC